MAARILLVEDDPALRESLRNLLSVAGYDMNVADTLGALQAHFLEPAPQALLLDLDSPDGPGLAALTDVKKNWPACKVVILTADGSLKATEDVYKLDDVFLLSKPLDPEMLESVLQMALTQRFPVS
jgi:DNA-binding NtrC family response regulator